MCECAFVSLRAILNCYPEPQIMTNKLPQAHDLLPSSLYLFHPEETSVANTHHSVVQKAERIYKHYHRELACKAHIKESKGKEGRKAW